MPHTCIGAASVFTCDDRLDGTPDGGWAGGATLLTPCADALDRPAGARTISSAPVKSGRGRGLMRVRSSSLALAQLPRFRWPALALLLCGATACSTASLAGGGGSGGGCPCEVGNSGIHFTIGCGESQCITLDGQALGYRCSSNGATQDPSVCTAPDVAEPAADTASKPDASSVDTDAPEAFDGGPCGHPCTPPQTCGGGGIAGFYGYTPKSCAELQLCGQATDDCGKPVTCADCASGLVCAPDNRCRTPATNLIVIGNYQGGTFAINVDKHLPNLGIGLVSYQSMNVTIGGAFANDVVAVAHAGYQAGTTVSGVAPGVFTDALLPKAGPGVGPADIIVDDIPASAMPPTKAEIISYLQDVMGDGAPAFHQCQYAAYSGTLLVSQGGTCN